MADTKKTLPYVPAPVPANEKERLESLQKLNILDTVPEERFDRITHFALDAFNAPISTISLIDRQREWYKSCQGLPEREGKRAISFCGHALLNNDIYIIPDTKKDPRFAKNPLVIRKPGIRFYAGVPIKSADGQRIGVFCIKDYKPRRLNKKQQSMLKSLASWAELEVNFYKLGEAIEARKKAEEKIVNLNKILRLLNKILRHDILNNLTVVKVSLEFLLTGRGKERDLHAALASANRSQKLIDQMKQLERAVATGAPLTAWKIKKTISELFDRFPEMKINLKEDSEVLADEALVSVFENILHNARVHGKASKITVSAKTNRKQVIINIADNGVGIPNSVKKNLFVEGFRHGTTGNTGLGLYIVKKTIERYGGDIWVENNKPKGTKIVIALPQAK